VCLVDHAGQAAASAEAVSPTATATPGDKCCESRNNATGHSRHSNPRGPDLEACGRREGRVDRAPPPTTLLRSARDMRSWFTVEPVPLQPSAQRPLPRSQLELAHRQPLEFARDRFQNAAVFRREPPTPGKAAQPPPPPRRPALRRSKKPRLQFPAARRSMAEQAEAPARFGSDKGAGTPGMTRYGLAGSFPPPPRRVSTIRRRRSAGVLPLSRCSSSG